MQNNDQHIDNVFKQKLNSFEVNPPEQLWDRINNSMDKGRKRRTGFFIIALSSAATLLFAFMLGWQLTNTTVEKNTIISKAEPETIQPATAAKNNLESKREIVLGAENMRNPNQVVQNTARQTTLGTVTRIKGEKTVNPMSREETLSLLASKNEPVAYTSVNYDDLAIAKNDSDEEFTIADRAIIEANMLAMNVTNENDAENSQGEWAFGVQGSPVYQFDQPAFGKMYDAGPDLELDQNNVSTSYNTTVSGGVVVEYLTSSRLSVQTGVNYAAVTQTGGKIGVSFLGNSFVTDRGDKLYETNSLDSWGNTESLNDDNSVVLTTNTGLANISLSPGATLTASKKENTFGSEVAKNYDYKQQARYIEVPLVLRYNLIDKRVGMHLLGGINSNFLVDNLVQLANQNEVIARGKIEGLRSLTFSSSLGFGLNYELTDKFQLSVEPTLKMQLSSMNSNSNFDSRPYTIGVFSGIAYRF